MADDNQITTQDTSDDSDNSGSSNQFDPNSAFSQMIAALQKSVPHTKSPYQNAQPTQQAPSPPPVQPRPMPPPPQPVQPPPQQQQWGNAQVQQQPAQQQAPQDYSVGINENGNDKPQNIWQKIYASLVKNNPRANSRQILQTMKEYKDAGAFDQVAKEASQKTVEQQVYDAAVKNGKSPFDAAQEAVKATTKIADNIGVSGKTVEEQVYNSLIKQGMNPMDALVKVQGLRGVSPDQKGAGEAAKQKADTDAIADKKAQEEVGKARGTEEVSYAKLQAGMPAIETAVKSLSNLANTANYTVAQNVMADARRQIGLPVGQGAIDAAQYEGILNNVLLPRLRQIFGARVTNFDVQAAAKMLGNPKLSPPEKQKQLESFISQATENVKTEGQTVKNLGGNPSPAMQEDTESTPNTGGVIQASDYFK